MESSLELYRSAVDHPTDNAKGSSLKSQSRFLLISSRLVMEKKVVFIKQNSSLDVK